MSYDKFLRPGRVGCEFKDGGRTGGRGGLIRYYFIRGFEYMEIIHFLSKYHGKSISERTLHRRLREYGLNRRTNYGINEIEEEVRKLLDGPECLVGYRPFSIPYNGEESKFLV